MALLPQLLILSGLQGSGKTKRALEWVAEDPVCRRRLNWDDLRIELYGPDHRFNRAQEEVMKRESEIRVKGWIQDGFSVVIDNTNLSHRTRNRWKHLDYTCPVEILEEEMDVPVAECVRRDSLREHQHQEGCELFGCGPVYSGGKFQGTITNPGAACTCRARRARVGRAVIERAALFHGFIDWNDEEAYIRSASGKDFVIVDVDGTLADTSHREHFVQKRWQTNTACPAHFPGPEPSGKCVNCGEGYLKKDWKSFFANVHLDQPIRPIFKLAKILSEHYYIIVVSGRPIDPCGKPTEDWLNRHADFPILHLFMRASDDKGPDYQTKQEILDLLPKDRIAYVLDDRPSVLRMWRNNGLTTLAVGSLEEF